MSGLSCQAGQTLPVAHGNDGMKGTGHVDLSILVHICTSMQCMATMYIYCMCILGLATLSESLPYNRLL